MAKYYHKSLWDDKVPNMHIDRHIEGEKDDEFYGSGLDSCFNNGFSQFSHLSRELLASICVEKYAPPESLNRFRTLSAKILRELREDTLKKNKDILDELKSRDPRLHGLHKKFNIELFRRLHMASGDSPDNVNFVQKLLREGAKVTGPLEKYDRWEDIPDEYLDAERPSQKEKPFAFMEEPFHFMSDLQTKRLWEESIPLRKYSREVSQSECEKNGIQPVPCFGVEQGDLIPFDIQKFRKVAVNEEAENDGDAAPPTSNFIKGETSRILLPAKYRMCCDFRRINKSCSPDKRPPLQQHMYLPGTKLVNGLIGVFGNAWEFSEGFPNSSQTRREVVRQIDSERQHYKDLKEQSPQLNRQSCSIEEILSQEGLRLSELENLPSFKKWNKARNHLLAKAQAALRQQVGEFVFDKTRKESCSKAIIPVISKLDFSKYYYQVGISREEKNNVISLWCVDTEKWRHFEVPHQLFGSLHSIVNSVRFSDALAVCFNTLFFGVCTIYIDDSINQSRKECSDTTVNLLGLMFECIGVDESDKRESQNDEKGTCDVLGFSYSRTDTKMKVTVSASAHEKYAKEVSAWMNEKVGSTGFTNAGEKVMGRVYTGICMEDLRSRPAEVEKFRAMLLNPEGTSKEGKNDQREKLSALGRNILNESEQTFRLKHKKCQVIFTDAALGSNGIGNLGAVWPNFEGKRSLVAQGQLVAGNLKIFFCELYTVLLAIQHVPVDDMAIIYIDNTAVIFSILKGRSKSGSDLYDAVIKMIIEACKKRNVRIVFRYISSKRNVGDIPTRNNLFDIMNGLGDYAWGKFSCFSAHPKKLGLYRYKASLINFKEGPVVDVAAKYGIPEEEEFQKKRRNGVSDDSQMKVAKVRKVSTSSSQ